MHEDDYDRHAAGELDTLPLLPVVQPREWSVLGRDEPENDHLSGLGSALTP